MLRLSELKQLAGLFLKLGVTAFGGPAAHVAMMEEEVVARRQWVTRERFLLDFCKIVLVVVLVLGECTTSLSVGRGQQQRLSMDFGSGGCQQISVTD
jgi:chromate transporter